MKKFLCLLLSLFTVASPALAQSPIIWSAGGQAKLLNAGSITFKNGSTIEDGARQNLIPNGFAEDPKNPGWTIYKNTVAGPVPETGSAGAPTLVTAAVQDTTFANLISGRGTWKLAKASGNAQGEGWAIDFLFPPKTSLYSSFVQLKFKYNISAAVGADAVRVYLYDKSNSTLITPSFTTCGGGSTPSLTTTTTTCAAELGWVSTTSDNYRLIFHVATTSTTAFDLYVDDLFTGDSGGAQVGPCTGPWTAYTPTFGNFTVSASSFYYRRECESIRVFGAAELNSAVSGTMSVSLPAGLTFAPSPDANGTDQATSGFLTGNIIGRAASGGNRWTALPYKASSTTINFNTIDNGISASGALWNATVPATWNSGSRLERVEFYARINEWSGVTSVGENKTFYVSHDGSNIVYGPAGAAMLTTTPSSTSDAYDISAAIPNKTGVSYKVQIQRGGTGAWTELDATTERLRFDGTNFIGVGVINDGAGGVALLRGKYRRGSTDSWAGITAGSRWRVEVASPGVPVPYGLASATVPGLISTDTQTFAGAKTFNGAVTLSGTGGNVPYGCSRVQGTATAIGGTTATVTCSAGKIVVGGGCTVSTSTGAVGLYESYPSADDKWTCQRLASGGGTMQAYAICCSQ